MKYALKNALLGAFLIFAVYVAPAHATAITKETANQYYLNCKAKPDPRFSEQAQDMFCGCTATKLMSDFTLEDMQSIGKQDQSGRDATNKMIVNIYAPCIQYPAKEYHYQSCISNPKTSILGDAQKLCSCASEQIAVHLQSNAKLMFQTILRTNPNITDPMQALYDDPRFQSFAKQKLMGCIR